LNSLNFNSSFNILLIIAIILFAIVLFCLTVFLIVYLIKKKIKKTQNPIISNKLKLKSKKITAKDLKINPKNNIYQQKVIDKYQDDNKKKTMDAKAPFKAISKEGYFSVYRQLKKIWNKVVRKK